MAGHVVSQVRHHQGSLARLFHSRALDLKKVKVSIDVHFATLVVEHMGGRHELTVTLVEMEESLQVVDVRGREEVWRSQFHSEPPRNSQVLVPECALSRILFNCHVNAESGGVEIKHDGLLFESKSSVRLTNDSIDIAVGGLLQIYLIGVDLVDVLSNL